MCILFTLYTNSAMLNKIIRTLPVLGGGRVSELTMLLLLTPSRVGRVRHKLWGCHSSGGGRQQSPSRRLGCLEGRGRGAHLGGHHHGSSQSDLRGQGGRWGLLHRIKPSQPPWLLRGVRRSGGRRQGGRGQSLKGPRSRPEARGQGRLASRRGGNGGPEVGAHCSAARG